MKLRAGQAGKICLEAAHQIGRIALLLFMLVLAALGLFAFSLSRHPLELPRLASWLATTVSGDGISVRVDHAELAWSGYRQGGGVPLVLRLNDIAVRSAAGALLVDIPQADAVVPPADLFGGRDAILLHASAARLPGSEAAVSIRANIWPGGGYTLARGTFVVSIGPGMLGITGAGVPISSASFTLLIAPGAADITDGTATLAPIGGSAPHAGFSFTARRDKNWTGSLHATIDAVRAQELGQYWPAVTLPATRDWVVKHITAGTAGNAAFTFSLSAPGDLSDLDLTNATGGFDGTGLTLYWLAGGIPITGLDGSFTMPDEDEAVIISSAGQEGNVLIRQGRMDITGLSQENQTGILTLDLAGLAPDVLEVLNAPPLTLLHSAPPMVLRTTGQVEGTVKASIPFEKNLTLDDVGLDAAVKLHDFAMPVAPPNLGFSRGEAQIHTDGHSLTLQAKALFAGEPARIALTERFAGAGAEDLSLSGGAGPQIWHVLGLDTATALSGPAGGTAPFTLHVAGTATGAQTAVLHADLTPASLALPTAGWSKTAGAAGNLAMTMRLDNGAFVALQNFTAQAPGLDVAGVQQGNALVFATADIGRTQATGTLSWPAAQGADWVADFSGPVLDLRHGKQSRAAPVPPRPSAAKPATAQPATLPSGPVWTARLNFAQLYLAEAPAPALGHFTLAAQGQGGTLLQAHAVAEGVTLDVTPQNPTSRELVLHGANAGALLRALGQYDHLEGGTLALTAVYGGGRPVTGKATLLEARFAKAPEVTKFLQALTLYGLADAASGPGLKISRAEIPFTLQDGLLTLHGARAFSSSLGFTANGSFDLVNDSCDLDTTIVPLYALNALPGKIPLIGRLFSPEKGGGLLAMRAHISGPIGHTTVRANPLSALTPGFLRSIFGIGEKKP